MVIHAQDYVSITLKDGWYIAQDYVSITLKDGDTCTRLCINHLKIWWYMHKIMYQSH